MFIMQQLHVHYWTGPPHGIQMPLSLLAMISNKAKKATRPGRRHSHEGVIPTKASFPRRRHSREGGNLDQWIPAFAGMTEQSAAGMTEQSAARMTVKSAAETRGQGEGDARAAQARLSSRFRRDTPPARQMSWLSDP